METTLLVHGVPPEAADPLATELEEIVLSAGGAGEAGGAVPALIGLVDGVPTVGMTRGQLDAMLEAHAASPVAKANTANLGLLMHRRQHAATTVSATMEIAAAAGVQVFATGGIGGVHRGYGTQLDISSDLAALARFPVAVVASGVKSILDVAATREALETLGVPVVGFQTDSFPSFYLRTSDATVDARFDTADELAAFVRAELKRTGRGILIANPIPEDDELDREEFGQWLVRAEAVAIAQGAQGRSVTPLILGALHQISSGKTLTANLSLIRSNVSLAAAVATAGSGS
ncbi:MAG: pseudouridine-5'-phosphate glycosidase [Phycisphaerales bacterium]|jgi:pseudouridine-5'-phosphate glycosidase